jgi:hypothetical protein
MKAFSLLPIFLSACTIGYDDASVTTTTKSGVAVTKRERMMLVQGPGGVVSQKAANGASITADNQQSARDLSTAVGGAYAAKQGTVALESNNNVKNVAAGEVTKQQGQVIAGQTAQTKIAGGITAGAQKANVKEFSIAVKNKVPVGTVQPISPP